MRTNFCQGSRPDLKDEITGRLFLSPGHIDMAELRHFTSYTCTRFLGCKLHLSRQRGCKFRTVSLKGVTRRTLRQFTRGMRRRNLS